MNAQGCKQSVYFEGPVLDALVSEAKRLDRSLSWVAQRCVKIGLPDVRALVGVEAIEPMREAAE
jgi:uncharacterized small protein (TIGR04563 family)